MNNKKIVIAGAGGYLASNVLPALIEKEGNILYALSSRDAIRPRLNAEENVRFFKIDMDGYGEAGKVIADGCDVAVNFSWIGARGREQDEDAVQMVNEINSLKLLESLIRAGCSRFIQIGSMAEYGVVEGRITESMECHPITAYAKRKLNCADKMRKICEASGVDFLEFRMGSMYGNYMGEGNILGYLCRELSKKRPVTLKTSCEQDWEYTHVEDFKEILLQAIHKKVPPGVYNISNGETHPLKYFIHIIERKYGLSGYVEFGNIGQGIGCQNIRCDISKIQNVFKKSDFISFRDGIDTVIDAIEGNPLD